MPELTLKICFWYLDKILVEDIVSKLHDGAYHIEYCIFKDTKEFGEYLDRKNVDLIFADFDLPDILRESIEKFHVKYAFHIPFIYLVGEKNEKKAAESLKRGVWDYILKENLVKLVPTVYSSQKYGKVLRRNKRMEDSAQQSREQFMNLAEHSPDVIMRFDKKLRHLYVNNSVYTQIGIPAEKFINKTHEEMGVFPPELVSFWEESLSTVFKTSKPNKVEFDVETEHGVKSYEWRIFPEFNKQNKVEYLLANARDITESRKAERALKLSEERLKLAVEATNLGYWDWNLETNHVYYSKIYFEMLGYGPDDLPRDLDTWHHLLHPDDREEAIEFAESNVRNKKSTFEAEFRLRSKDGSYVWIYSRSKVFATDENGRPLRLIGSHEDITERKRHELKHEVLFQISNAVNTTKNMDELYVKIQESLHPIIDTTNCFLALYDENTGLLNLPFLRDEKDEFNNFPPGKTLTGYVLKTGKAQLIDAAREKKLHQKGYIDPVGTPSSSWLGVPLKIDRKTTGVFVVQSYTDSIKYTEEDVEVLEFVSEQIALAIERKKDQDNLRESQEMQRRVFESSPDPILVANRKGQLLDYNSKFLKTLAISSEKAVGLKVFRFIERSDWRRAVDSFLYAWDFGYVSNLEFKVVKYTGEIFYSEISAGAVYKENGKPESMVMIIKDITDRKEAEKSLKKAKEKAEESDRLKTAFLSNMSHEIRTPMNAIVGFSDLLKDQDLSSEERAEFVAQINLGADNLMHLIDDIIDISKIEAGQLKVSMGTAEVHSLLKEQIVMIRQNLARRDKSDIELRLVWNWREEELYLSTDPYRLIQVITNLLNNALKFTDSGLIELGMESMGDNLRFYVKDSGIGITKEKQKIIFDRFMQAHTSNEKIYGGTGLGLAISKNLVNLLGGKIGVISEPGKGSEFWFTIPAKIQQIKIQEENLDMNLMELDWSGKKILIAEDDPANYNYLFEALKDTSIEILWAKSGIEALEMFKRQKDSINLVLMDIRMPEMNGNDCTKLIKAIRPETPVIAQTAYAMAEEKQTSIEYGCDGHISKPISQDVLFRTIGKYIK